MTCRSSSIAHRPIVVGVGGCVAYFWGANWLLDRCFLSATAMARRAVRNLRIATAIRPWLFLGPALLALTVYLIYPVVRDAAAVLPWQATA